MKRIDALYRGANAWRQTALVGVLVLSLLALRGSALLSRACSNAGLVVVGQALVAALEGTPPETAAQAEMLLRRAVAWDGGNQGAHLGLGIVYTLLKRPQYALKEWYAVRSREKSEFWEHSFWYRVGTALEPGLNGGVTEEWFRGEYLVLDSFSSAVAWQPCPWCENAAGYLGASQGVLVMSYRNMLGERNAFAFLSMLNVSVTDFSELLLRIKGESGTLLTVEIAVDGEHSRPLNYQPVPEGWETWMIPINGNILNEILIGLGEPEPVPTPEEYRLSIDWIALR